MHRATKNGSVRRLVNYAEPVFGNSILHFMAYDDLKDSATLLLKNGAFQDIRNVNEETPLHWAARVGSLKVVEVLLEHGANINASDSTGGTPLHSAAGAGNPESIPLLMASGANWGLTDGDGKTPLELARSGARQVGDDKDSQGQHAKEGFAAVIYIIEKNMKVKGDHHYVPDAEEPPKRRPGDFIPGVETQVDEFTLTQSASQTGMYTRLDAVNQLSEPELHGVDTGTLPMPRSPDARASSPQTKRTCVSLSAAQSAAAMNETMRSPQKKSIMAFWTSAGRSNFVGDGAERPAPVLVKPKKAVVDPRSLFPKAAYVPFLPKVGERLDVFIGVEQCADCHQHRMSLWHDQKKYRNAGDALLRAAVGAVHRQGYPCRIFAYKAKPNRSRLGALEVTISLRLSGKGAVDKLRAEVPSALGLDGIIQPDESRPGWTTYVVFSKLSTRSWPQVDEVAARTVSFLDQALVDLGEPVVKVKNKPQAQVDQLQSWSHRLFNRPMPLPEAEKTGSIASKDGSLTARTSRSTAQMSEVSGSNDKVGDEVAYLASTTTIPDDDYEALEAHETKVLKHFFVYDGRSAQGKRVSKTRA